MWCSSENVILCNEGCFYLKTPPPMYLIHTIIVICPPPPKKKRRRKKKKKKKMLIFYVLIGSHSLVSHCWSRPSNRPRSQAWPSRCCRGPDCLGIGSTPFVLVYVDFLWHFPLFPFKIWHNYKSHLTCHVFLDLSRKPGSTIHGNQENCQKH